MNKMAHQGQQPNKSKKPTVSMAHTSRGHANILYANSVYVVHSRKRAVYPKDHEKANTVTK